MVSLCQVVSLLLDPSFLERCSLLPTLGKRLSPDHPQISAHDELADLAVMLVVHLLRHRLWRMAFMLWGWPCQSALFTDADVAVWSGAMDDLKLAMDDLKLAVRRLAKRLQLKQTNSGLAVQDWNISALCVNSGRRCAGFTAAIAAL